MCLTALIPGLGELQTDESVGSESWNPSTLMTDTMYNDLGLVSTMHQHSGVSKADDTQNSRG